MILSIESSCDDSSLAVTEIESYRLIWHKKMSQESEHKNYGGVVPELASRLHAVNLPKLLEKAKPYLDSLKAVAVTNEPGLSVTLNEGVMMAKSIATFLNIPLIPVNHLKGHIYSLFIEKATNLPMIIVLISGGHTMVIRAESIDNMTILASSIDDSVGESYDKVAKMLNLGYPGGPIIEEFAKSGDENRFNYPVPLKNSPLIAFSLSGLKNAVRLSIEKLGGVEALNEKDVSDISASFQKAVVAHLIQKSRKVLAQERIKNIALVGGVSANLYIRENFNKLSKKMGKKLYTAPLKFCSDNAGMIGRYGVEAFNKGYFISPQQLKVSANRKLKVGDKL